MIHYARFAEQAEMYDKMRNKMRQVVLDKRVLSVEERNLLSVAYKNVVGARRASWRVLNSIMTKETEDENLAQVKGYKAQVEKELSEICEDVLEVLTETLLERKDIEPEERVFYYKMKGDYHRYMAE